MEGISRRPRWAMGQEEGDAPDPGREHRHVASAGELGPLAGPGCGAQAGAGASEHPRRQRLPAPGPRACSRPAPTSSSRGAGSPSRAALAPRSLLPRETRLPAPGAPAAGATAGPGATPPPEGADARTSPARAAEPPPGRPLPGPRRGTERERSRSPAVPTPRSAGPEGLQLPQCRARRGGAGGAAAGWDSDPRVDPCSDLRIESRRPLWWLFRERPGPRAAARQASRSSAIRAGRRAFIHSFGPLSPPPLSSAPLSG